MGYRPGEKRSMSFRRYRVCDCKNRPGLVSVNRVKTPTSTWDVATYSRTKDGKTIVSSTSDGWYDVNNGEWPISPLCRYRWLPQVKEQIRRFLRVS